MNNMYDILGALAAVEANVTTSDNTSKATLKEGVSQTNYPKAAHHIDEEPNEGNDFTGERLAAIKNDENSFTVDGKTYKVTGDTDDEKGQIHVETNGYDDRRRVIGHAHWQRVK